MFALTRLNRRHALAALLALVVAVLLSASWGQVHRVLHTGLSLAQAETAPAGAAPQLGHEDGSTLCQLLDQLTHGSAPGPLLSLPLADLPRQAPASLAEARPLAFGRAAFQARAPPRPA